MGEAADKMIEAMRAAGDRLHGWGDEAQAHAVWDGADALSIALWDRSEADRVAKECADWLIAAEARISTMKSALEELLAFADTMVSCQDSPHRGEWDAECPLCMGELIEQADRAMIAKASAALAGGIEATVDTPTAKAEESAVYPDRETIARIIDPDAWIRLRDRDQGARDYAGRHGGHWPNEEELFEHVDGPAKLLTKSLTKADAILALAPAEARSEQLSERNI